MIIRGLSGKISARAPRRVSEFPMRDSDTSISAYRMLSRAAFYMLLLAWISLGAYIFLIMRNDGSDADIINYFLSIEEYGIRFRALVLLAPLILSVLSYLIHERAKLFKKTLLAEKELRQKTIELENINELLTRENIARKKAEDQLVHHAFYDSLTNLPNRALFIDHLQSALERRRVDRGARFAVMILDVDRFKVINDSLGHAIGDQLLLQLSQRLREIVRPGDTVAYLGGDEFAILMEDAKETWYVDELADRIRDAMRTAFNVFGHEIFATLSIGTVLSVAAEYSEPEELIRDADTAMNHAKGRGNACHAIFDPAMHAEVTTVLWLETELRKGLEQNELTVYYQPIISLENYRILGFEALARWQHPERGLLLPLDFMTVAEESGLIVPISYRVIHEACWQVRQWQIKFPGYRNLTASVNVSAKVFSQPDFYEIIEQILRETSLDAGSLRIEIIEKVVIDNPEPAAALMKRMKNLNIRFDIDGFGTGYSALNYLRHFPIDGLKIDRSFIKMLPFDRYNAEIVRTIIALAETLKLEVIAEGIETSRQLEEFKAMKGKFAQGFFLFEPMDSKAAENLLA
jgi:diguanylate cyclase (GGDEF)-like protein